MPVKGPTTQQPRALRIRFQVKTGRDGDGDGDGDGAQLSSVELP
jgi:hypothetical protein